MPVDTVKSLSALDKEPKSKKDDDPAKITSLALYYKQFDYIRVWNRPPDYDNYVSGVYETQKEAERWADKEYVEGEDDYGDEVYIRKVRKGTYKLGGTYVEGTSAP